ncbi:MAG: hypothetical protein ACXW3E_13070, partial [Thermoanaerobaculia bacterium]
MSICGHRAPAFALAIVFAALPLLAQTQDEKIQQLQKLEQKLKDFQEQIDALAAQARVLQEEINAAKARQQVAPSKPAEGQPVEPATTPEQSIAPSSTEAPTGAPITIVSGAAGKNFLNLSLDGLLAVGTSTTPNVRGLEIGGHDPTQRGFTVQNVETVFEGAVDPYFRGQANVVLQINPDGGTQVEL